MIIFLIGLVLGIYVFVTCMATAYYFIYKDGLNITRTLLCIIPIVNLGICIYAMREPICYWCKTTKVKNWFKL